MAETSEQDKSLKTEDPTPHRLEEARKKGHVVFSREVVTWFIMISGAINLAYIFPPSARSLSSYLAQFLSKGHEIDVTMQNIKLLSIDCFLTVGKLVFLPFFLIILMAIFGTGIQTRFAMNTEHIKPSLSKISLAKGFQRLFSTKSIVEFAKGFLKILFVGLMFTMLLKQSLTTVENFILLSQNQIIGQLLDLSLSLLIIVIEGMFVVCILDYLFQRNEYMKSLKMSRFEVLQELKEMEGDPFIKSKLKQIRAGRARQRMMAEVPKATVIVTNPTHYAVGLQYIESQMEAPIIVAKGVDLVALKIREVASKHWIPIVQNPPLAQILYKELDINESIHPDHYKAVAEVIRYVQSLKNSRSFY